MNKKNIGIILVVVILLVGGYFAFSSGFMGGSDTETEETSDFVATVNGEGILKADFDTQVANALSSLQSQGADLTSVELLAQVDEQILNDLINNEVVNQAMAEAGIAPTSEQVEAEITAIRENLGGEEALQAEFVNNGITEEQFRTNIFDQLSLQLFLETGVDSTKITVTEEEILALYDQAVATQEASDGEQPEIPPLEEVRAQVEQQITNDKRQAQANAFVASLREAADVEIMTVEEEDGEAMEAKDEA